MKLDIKDFSKEEIFEAYDSLLATALRLIGADKLALDTTLMEIPEILSIAVTSPQDNWISVDKLNESYVGKKVIFNVGEYIFSGSIAIDDGELYFQDNYFEIYTGITMFQVVSLPTPPSKGVKS